MTLRGLENLKVFIYSANGGCLLMSYAAWGGWTLVEWLLLIERELLFSRFSGS
jgi:hypothetical protein